MKRVALPFVLALAIVFAVACGSDDKSPTGPDPAGAATEAHLGDQSLASGDYAAANAHYKAALAKDGTNAQANVGAAVTEIYLLQSDPQVDSLVRALDGQVPLPAPRNRSGVQSNRATQLLRGLGLRSDGAFDPVRNGQRAARMFMNITADPPALSRIQAVIKLKVMPKLQYAEERLALVEAHPEWVFLLPPTVTDAPDTVELDLGEIYAVDAVVNNVQGWLGIVVAYNFDFPNPIELVPADSLLAPGTNFGKLWTDGALQLAGARLNFLLSKTRLDQAVAFINAETDVQDDDVIPKAALTEPGFVDFMTQFNQAYNSLNAAVTVSVDDYQGNPQSIQILTKNFFTNPIADWKTKLPTHTFVNHEPQVTDPVTFPDPLFNGIFPNMTNLLWQGLIGPVNPTRPAMRASR